VYVATRTRLSGAALSAVLLSTLTPAVAAPRALAVGGSPTQALLPTGQYITATAAPQSQFIGLHTDLRPDGNADAADATATALSPDGKTLLVLTSGFNLDYYTESGAPITHKVPNPVDGSLSTTTTTKSEWVFVYDVTSGTPRKQQQISIPNTYDGIAWAPDTKSFYVSGGIDDRILVYTKTAAGSSAAATGVSGGTLYTASYPSVILGHNPLDNTAFPTYKGSILKDTPAGAGGKGALPIAAVAANIAVSGDGKKLVVANMENDSLSVVDTTTRKIFAEVHFFRPGQSSARGEFPYGVAIRSDAKGVAQKVYVTSLRDDQVDVIDTSGRIRVIPVGSGPNNVVMSKDQRRLYVADGNADAVSVIDTDKDALIGTYSIARPGDHFKGSNPNGLALSPDEKTLYVTLGGENAVAVCDVPSRRVIGRIPTGWYPTGVSVSNDGRHLYIVNEKSVPGPNPGNADGQNTAAGLATNTTFRNEYTWALQKAGLLVVPTPDASTLGYLSRLVDDNNGFYNRHPSAMMSYLHRRIDHVIYIVKENRTYDQVLGDLRGANGAPALTLFPQPISPNHHKLAADYVALDNFYDPGESSGVGWNWSTAGHTTDYVERNQAVDYGNGGDGLSYDYEGVVRNINLGLPQTGPRSPFSVRETGLLDPSGASSIMPGRKDVSAPEEDGVLDPHVVGGYIWDEALRRSKSLRNYGFFVDLNYYRPTSPAFIPITDKPYEQHVPQAPYDKPALFNYSDVYFRGFDQKVPDKYRYDEWSREFDQYVKGRNLPALELVRFEHDHFGAFSSAVANLNTPQLQMADNDYALGKLVDKVTHSPYAASTAIFVLEDDSQNGPDHVDSHRSFAFVVSPYTRRKTLLHTTYTTENVLRTMEDLLGLEPLGQQDADAAPMDDAFQTTANAMPYEAILPGSLCAPPVTPGFIPECSSRTTIRTRSVASLQNGDWWAGATDGMDFEHPDSLDSGKFNSILWYGMTGSLAPNT